MPNKEKPDYSRFIATKENTIVIRAKDRKASKASKSKIKPQ